MKRIFFVLLLVLCVVPFASAEYTANNGSLATTGAIWVAGGTYSAQTAEVICGVYGLTPTYASGYWHDTVFLEYSTVPLSQYNNSVPAWNVDNVTQVDKIVPEVVGPAYITIGQRAICGSNDPYIAVKHLYYNSSIYAPAPTANFTAAPTSGAAPLYVMFDDTSENETGTCTYNWSITPASGVSAGATGTMENHAASFSVNGSYTVSHGVSCPSGSDIETKTDYIWVYAPNETETTYFYTYNPLSGYEIHDSNIYLNDIENGSWVNSTSDADGRLGITALSTHHINAYSDKEGFGDGELLNQLASGLSYPLIMFPSNVTNVSAGNVTLYINVIDTWAPGTPVSGATVSITYAWPAIQYGTTNEAGMISFTVPNNTVIQVAANKAGYTGVSDSVNSGTGSGGEASVSKTLYITKKTVTTAPTATTLPGGGTPTPQVTYLPHCDPSAADYDEALCRASKGGVGLNLLADYMDDLILLCIFVTIMYLLGFKLGG